MLRSVSPYFSDEQNVGTVWPRGQDAIFGFRQHIVKDAILQIKLLTKFLSYIVTFLDQL